MILGLYIPGFILKETGRMVDAHPDICDRMTDEGGVKVKKCAALILALIMMAGFSFTASGSIGIFVREDGSCDYYPPPGGCMIGGNSPTTDPSTVAAITEDIWMAPGFSDADLASVRKLIKEEYNRGIKTRSVRYKGELYFDYGKSTEELVHAWIGEEHAAADGTALPASACMVQDFVGGNSDNLEVLGKGGKWCCIMVTPESLKKGEAYTVRDAFANAWGNAGGPNSFWGLPTGNQFWIDNMCYQTFEYGYAAAENAQILFTEFHLYADGETAPVGGVEDNPNWLPEAETSTDPTSMPYPVRWYPYHSSTSSLNEESSDGLHEERSEEAATFSDAPTEEEFRASADTALLEDEDMTSPNSRAAALTGRVGAAGGTTTKTYFLGMELTPLLQKQLIVGAVALGVLSAAAAAVVVSSILVHKRRRRHEAALPTDPDKSEDVQKPGN